MLELFKSQENTDKVMVSKVEGLTHIVIGEQRVVLNDIQLEVMLSQIKQIKSGGQDRYGRIIKSGLSSLLSQMELSLLSQKDNVVNDYPKINPNPSEYGC